MTVRYRRYGHVCDISDGVVRILEIGSERGLPIDSFPISFFVTPSSKKHFLSVPTDEENEIVWNFWEKFIQQSDESTLEMLSPRVGNVTIGSETDYIILKMMIA